MQNRNDGWGKRPSAADLKRKVDIKGRPQRMGGGRICYGARGEIPGILNRKIRDHLLFLLVQQVYRDTTITEIREETGLSSRRGEGDILGNCQAMSGEMETCEGPGKRNFFRRGRRRAGKQCRRGSIHGIQKATRWGRLLKRQAAG